MINKILFFLKNLGKKTYFKKCCKKNGFKIYQIFNFLLILSTLCLTNGCDGYTVMEEVENTYQNTTIKDSVCFKSKVLVNNVIKDYNIINLSITANDCTLDKMTLLDSESKVLVFETKNIPNKYVIHCSIRCVDGGIVNNLYGEVNNSYLQFTTINISPELLGLKKISFSANVGDFNTVEVEN